jgi:mRNA interferase RelE/StbE
MFKVLVFEVLLDPRAAKAPKKLDETDRARMKKALAELAVDPRKTGKPLHPSDFWSLRAGDYRAIYEIDSDEKRVIVLFTGHRKNVYGDFAKML